MADSRIEKENRQTSLGHLALPESKTVLEEQKKGQDYIKEMQGQPEGTPDSQR